MYSEADIEALIKLQGSIKPPVTYGEIKMLKRSIEERRNNLEPVWIPRSYNLNGGEWEYFHPRAADLNPRLVHSEDHKLFVAEFCNGQQGVKKLGPVSVAEAVLFIENTVY